MLNNSNLIKNYLLYCLYREIIPHLSDKREN